MFSFGEKDKLEALVKGGILKVQCHILIFLAFISSSRSEIFTGASIFLLVPSLNGDDELLLVPLVTMFPDGFLWIEISSSVDWSFWVFFVFINTCWLLKEKLH